MASSTVIIVSHGLGSNAQCVTIDWMEFWVKEESSVTPLRGVWKRMGHKLIQVAWKKIQREP